MAVVMARNEPTSTEMNPMYARMIQDHPSTSQSPMPCDVSNRDTATSETYMNPHNLPEREAPAQSGYPSTRLDADSSIYGKGSAKCPSRDRLWSCVKIWPSLVLSMVACAFAVAALIVTLPPNTTEQVRGWESRLQFNFAASSVWP